MSLLNYKFKMCCNIDTDIIIAILFFFVACGVSPNLFRCSTVSHDVFSRTLYTNIFHVIIKSKGNNVRQIWATRLTRKITET